LKTVFLDLDGTLTDPKPGVTRSFIYALDKLGMKTPTEDELEWVIGPALKISFEKLGVPDVEQAIGLYRERYIKTGLFENRVYDGIPNLLAGLKNAGMTMCLATAKPHAYARIITAHFGLAPYLAHEFGPELDGTRNNKGDLLAYALDLTGIDAATSVMVGDRHHDVDAGDAVGMETIGVTWGYGRDGELDRAGAVCNSPAELLDMILAKAG
jgi:phosphoglycolate phosphatase